MVQAFLLTDSLEKVRDQKRCNESSPVAEVGMENRSQPSGLLIGKNKNKELQTSLFVVVWTYIWIASWHTQTTSCQLQQKCVICIGIYFKGIL